MGAGNKDITFTDTEAVAAEIMNSMSCLIQAHKGFAELGEVYGNNVVILCGGQCIDCDDKCIEDALRERLPDINIIYR